MVQVPARSADQTLRFDEKPDEDAITLCERYLSRLNTLVYLCRKKFDTVASNRLVLPFA